MPQRRRRFANERPPDPDAVDTARRLFIAVSVPEAAREVAAERIAALTAAGPLPVRWVDPGQAHVTLRFIGEVGPEQAELIRLAVGPAVAGHEVFRVRTGDLGVFPNLRRPRVLWLGIHGPAHRLVSIHDDIDVALAELELDLPPADDEFRPHMTLGRLRNAPGVPIARVADTIRQRVNALNGPGAVGPPAPIPVDDVLLMRSILDHRGSRYEVIERYPLAARSRRD